MPFIRAQCIIHTADNVPANFVTNTLSFEFATLEVEKFEDLKDVIAIHYSGLANNFYPSSIKQTGHEVKFYLIGTPPPSYPVEAYTFDMSFTPSADQLPQEVALVASFQGPKVSGIPQARRRGRNYIGPLKSALNSNGRPSTTAVSNLATRFGNFGSEVNAISGVTWGVYSEQSSAFTAITDGWVDNAWDTQRSRGVVSTARTTFDV